MKITTALETLPTTAADCRARIAGAQRLLAIAEQTRDRKAALLAAAKTKHAAAQHAADVARETERAADRAPLATAAERAAACTACLEARAQMRRAAGNVKRAERALDRAKDLAAEAELNLQILRARLADLERPQPPTPGAPADAAEIDAAEIEAAQAFAAARSAELAEIAAKAAAAAQPGSSLAAQLAANAIWNHKCAAQREAYTAEKAAEEAQAAAALAQAAEAERARILAAARAAHAAEIDAGGPIAGPDSFPAYLAAREAGASDAEARAYARAAGREQAAALEAEQAAGRAARNLAEAAEIREAIAELRKAHRIAQRIAWSSQNPGQGSLDALEAATGAALTTLARIAERALAQLDPAEAAGEAARRAEAQEHRDLP